ncbi:MAG: type II toxin-antitoxin system prevent-host-death family antitoxin [Longimicrobiales bacterium]
MKKASISILKARLSQYLDAVKSGEEVIVTERGRPVARLVGLDVHDTPEGRTARLIREGRMRAPLESGSAADVLSWDDDVPADPEGRSLEVLLEERTEGR